MLDNLFFGLVFSFEAEVVISGGMSIPHTLTTTGAQAIPIPVAGPGKVVPPFQL